MNISPVDILLFAPIAFGLALLLTPGFTGAAAQMGVRLAAILHLVFVGFLAVQVYHNGSLKIARPWIPSFGASYLVELDFLALAYIATTVLVSCVAVLWWPHMERTSPKIFGLLFILEGALTGVFISRDLLLFYVFWELMLIPAYFAIGFFGGKRRIFATLMFVLYTVAGSILMLGSFTYLALLHRARFGAPSFEFSSLIHLCSTLGSTESIVLCSALILAGLVKLPAFPFHSWLPVTYIEAPFVFAMVLAAVVGKAGLYLLVSIALPLFPDTMVQFGPLFALLGTIAVIYGGLVAIAQTELKAILAYSSLSHLGVILLGVGTQTPIALSGALFLGIAHALSTALLFLVVGMLKERLGCVTVFDIRGLAARYPRFAGLIFFSVLGGISLPLTAGFIGEFVIFSASFSVYPTLAFVSMFGVVLSAVYLLSMYLKVAFGSPSAEPSPNVAQRKHESDLSSFELVPGLLLVGGLLILGIFPNLLFKIIPVLEPHLISAQTGIHENAGTTERGAGV